MRKLIFTLLFLIMLTQVEIEAKKISEHNKPYGGTLIWGVCHKPTLINPILTTQSISMSLLDLIFNRLVRINSKGEIEPDLAESWDISKDGLVYIFYLRKGMKFHDGVECTADDVKFTYDKLIDPEVNSPFKSSLQLVKDFKVIDRYTFQIILNKPSAPFIYRLIREIIPKHILEKSDLKDCSFNFHPVGTGPFRFKEWSKDNQITLEYNPSYYEGRPYLDKIIIKIYSDSQTFWTALMRSEIDYVGFMERQDFEVIKNDSAFKAYAFPLDCYSAIVYNLNDPVLADERVRKAIAYAVDRKGLIERVAFGYGLECNGPFYPESLGFNPNVVPFEYNPQKAKILLIEAGFKDINNDGILEKGGEDLEIRILVDARNDIYKRIALVLRQQLQSIGIKIKIILYNDDNELTEEFLKQNNPQAKIEFLLAGIDPAQQTDEWSSGEGKRINKLWVYKNEEVDRLFELGEIIQDRQERQKIYQKTHQIIYDEQPACFLYFPFVFHAISNKFENTDEFFNVNMPFYTMKDWYFRKTE